MSVQDNVVQDLIKARQVAIDAGADKNDQLSTPNDWVAYITAYLGRASRGVYRNEKEDQQYRDNLVKAGGLIISALVNFDRQQNRTKPETVELRATA